MQHYIIRLEAMVQMFCSDLSYPQSLSTMAAIVARLTSTTTISVSSETRPSRECSWSCSFRRSISRWLSKYKGTGILCDRKLEENLSAIKYHNQTSRILAHSSAWPICSASTRKQAHIILRNISSTIIRGNRRFWYKPSPTALTKKGFDARGTRDTVQKKRRTCEI